MIPDWAIGWDWSGWTVKREGHGPAYMMRLVNGYQDVRYQVRIHENNYLEIFRDGAEAGLDATFPTLDGALSVARSFIKEMGQ